jgi:hypothetical protein
MPLLADVTLTPAFQVIAGILGLAYLIIQVGDRLWGWKARQRPGTTSTTTTSVPLAGLPQQSVACGYDHERAREVLDQGHQTMLKVSETLDKAAMVLDSTQKRLESMDQKMATSIGQERIITAIDRMVSRREP